MAADQDLQIPTPEDVERSARFGEQIRAIIAERDRMISLGELDAQIASPSVMWQPILLMAYCLRPTPELIRTWRLHTYLFTGHFLGCAINHTGAIPEPLLQRCQEFSAGLPDEFIARPPRALGEMGWEHNGGLINEDVVMYQSHLAALYWSGALEHLKRRDSLRVLEIGGGYGALACFLKKLLPQARYYMADLPEALIFPAVYLGAAMRRFVADDAVYDGKDRKRLDSRGDGFTFVPNYLVEHLRDAAPFDLIVNTGSFGEMSREQVGAYAALAHDLLDRNGIFYEENQDRFIPVKAELESRFLNVQSPVGPLKRLWFKDAETLQQVASLRPRTADAAPAIAPRRSPISRARLVRLVARLLRVDLRTVNQ